MTKNELMADEACKKAIELFVNNKHYLLIKDFFVTNIETGERDSVAASTSDSLILSHGKHLQAIAIFKKFEEIANYKEPPPEPKKREAGRPDPDLQ